MSQTAHIRPSLWQCLWAVPFILTGGGFFAYTLVHGIMHVTDSLTQVVVPGSAELSLQPGQYPVFLEEQSVVNGRIYSTTESVNGLSCSIRSVKNGTLLAMTKSSGNVSYSVNGRSGRSVLEFPVQQAGRYAFACDYGEGKGPEVVVAVGSGVGSAIVSAVGSGLPAFFGGFGAGAVVVLVVVFKREREKKRFAQTAQTQI